MPAGQVVVVDTSSTTILGGANCSASEPRTFVGGVIDVRNFSLGAGAEIRVVGPNPLVILAGGRVRIDGLVNVSGVANPGVLTLNAANIPALGSFGNAGGGTGGTGSPQVNASSFAGSDGTGAFNGPFGGGRGGETGWNNVAASQLDGRRGAGGGGGVFGANQAQTVGPITIFGDWDQSFIGLDAEPGFDNLAPNANGSVSGAAGPFGGAVGASPFQDADPRNDFYGYGIDLATGATIVGELKRVWAGSGGGAGGDASFVGVAGSFPKVPFNPGEDERGAGGGGGAGGLRIAAQGDIVFGPMGLIQARGGSGGCGENTLFLNHVGGSSGGGSGGHVVLETAGVIDLRAVLGPSSTPGQLLGGILATGGEGGAGKNNFGGAQQGVDPDGSAELLPELDACPLASTGNSYPSSGPNACAARVDGTGGDGGPGVIQLHAVGGLDPMNPGILLPAGLSISDVCKPTPFGVAQGIELRPRL